MTYDHWKTTNPDDEFLGPHPDEEDQENECDICGEMKSDCAPSSIRGIDGGFACLACRRLAEDDDPAADRGDHECHQRRDR